MSKKADLKPVSTRVLIVDDHPNTASMLARVIRKLDPQLEVITASSGEDALEKLGDAIADVLITDFMMPGMSGLELIETLHDGRKPSHTILITAYNTPGLATTARRLDIQDYLVKPVEPEKISNIVSRALAEILPYRSASGTEERQRPFKILIADDYNDNLRLLSVRLRNEGYTHIVANDGEEALQKMRAEMPDLALLDVNMPNKDGFDVLKEMRADSQIAHIPAIMITAARIGVKDVQEGLTLGADDYITKPVDWRELSARIRAKLHVKHAEDTLRLRAQKLSVLPQISQDIGERLDIEDLTKSLLTRTVKALNASNGYLAVFHLDGEVTYQIHELFDFTPWTWGEVQDRITSEGLTARVFQAGQDFIVADTAQDDRWLEIPNDPTRSAICVPLMGRQDIIGVLTLTHKKPDQFNTEHLGILRAIASQAAVAIENTQLFAIERKRVNELVALNQISREIGQFVRSVDLFEQLPQLIRNTIGYPAVGFWTVNGEHINLQNFSGSDKSHRKKRLMIGPKQAAVTGQPVQLSGPIKGESDEPGKNASPAEQSVIAVPMIYEDAVSGVLSIHSNRAGAFHESDRVLLETLTAQVATVLQRILLFETAEQDKKRLAAVLQAAADAILLIDPNEEIQLANISGKRLFTDISTHVGQKLPRGVGYDALLDFVEAARQPDADLQAEILWPDERIFSVHATPIAGGGMVIVLNDVSHFKALEHIKDDFIAAASHDLKNPIHSVLGYSELLEKAGPLNEIQIDFVSRINSSAKQMHELVLNMLDLVMVDLGIKVDSNPIDLKSLLEKVADEFRPQAEIKDQSLELTLPEDDLMLKGNSLQLQQVLRNLIGNAIKYTPEKGDIQIESENSASTVWIRVIDTGLGIPEEDIPHIFDKFYRVQTDDRADIQGNGLGLAIVKSIIEQHHGKITLESTVGEGSCFSFSLPLAREPQPVG